MTNAQIIFNASCRLMEDGIIGTTGRKIVVEMADGTEQEFMEPEPIHTYQVWKSLGFQVKKGEKNIAAITIWKAGKSKNEEADGDTEGKDEQMRMFMKTAHFFKRSQCELIAG